MPYDYKQRPTMPPQNSRPPEWLGAILALTLAAALGACFGIAILGG